MGLSNETAKFALVFGVLIGGLMYFLRRHLHFIAVVLTVVGVSFAPLLPQGVNTLAENRMIIDILPDSLQHRLLIWSFAAKKVKEKPVIGWGLNASRALPHGEGTTLTGKKTDTMPLHPHNGVIQIWLELGAIGAGFLGIALVALLFYGRRMAQTPFRRSVVIGAYVTALTMFCASYGVWQAWWMAALALTITFFAALMTEEDGWAMDV